MDIQVTREPELYLAAPPRSACGLCLMVQEGCVRPAVTPTLRPAGRRQGQKRTPSSHHPLKNTTQQLYIT